MNLGRGVSQHAPGRGECGHGAGCVDRVVGGQRVCGEGAYGQGGVHYPHQVGHG